MAMTRLCRDCGEEFTVDVGTQRWLAERGLALPARCEPCRKVRREQQSQAPGPPRSGSGGGGHPR